jgi:hypothetical protein
MSDRAIVLWTIAACMAATAVAAQTPAPTPTAFDRTYVGVSRIAERPVTADYTRRGGSCGTRGYTPEGQPRPLTNAGGLPRYNGSTLHRANYEADRCDEHGHRGSP